MKNFFRANSFVFTIALLTLSWFFLLQLASYLSLRIPLHKEFLGPVPWANFDGALYLIISKFDYGLYQQAFFPLFPLLIHAMKSFFLVRTNGAFFVVYTSLIACIIIFTKLSLLDMPKKKVIWTLVFFLLFPTSFFFVSIYTESLFLALSLGSFYSMRKNKFVLASFLTGLASATRVVGIFLIPAMILEYLNFNKQITKGTVIKLFFLSLLGSFGLIGYMGFLWRKYSDPLLFLHVQSEFGANRTNGKIILLPQVIVRYVKILATVPMHNYDYWIALLEIASFSFVFILLLVNWKKIRLSYLLFSLSAILLPTLTGTLSSIPRYVLVAFPIFMLMGNSSKMIIKLILLLFFIPLLLILCALFLRGYFIA